MGFQSRMRVYYLCCQSVHVFTSRHDSTLLDRTYFKLKVFLIRFIVTLMYLARYFLIWNSYTSYLQYLMKIKLLDQTTYHPTL